MYITDLANTMSSHVYVSSRVAEGRCVQNAAKLEYPRLNWHLPYTIQTCLTLLHLFTVQYVTSEMDKLYCHKPQPYFGCKDHRQITSRYLYNNSRFFISDFRDSISSLLATTGYIDTIIRLVIRLQKVA